MAPSSVDMRAAIASPKFVSESWRRYSWMLAESLPTDVVTPWNVILTSSPCLRATMPNSFSRSNSPVLASATASII